MIGLLKRRRRGTGGEEKGPTKANLAESAGDSNVGKNGGGYEVQSYFPFFQGCIELSNIANIGLSASNTYTVKKDGTLWVTGNNSGIGTGGTGTIAQDILTPKRIDGNVPLYPFEEKPYTKEGGGIWTQPQGSIAPTIPLLAASTGGPGLAGWLLTRAGQSMFCGDGAEGQGGNGTNTLADSITFEKGPWNYTLTAQLSTVGLTTSLPIPELQKGKSIPAQSQIVTQSGGHGQVWLSTATAQGKTATKAGATSITVEAQKANFAYPEGAVIKALGYWPQYAFDWVRTGGPLLTPVGAERPDGGTYTTAEVAQLRVEADEHILSGISAISGAEKCCFFLMGSGEVFYTGQVAGENVEHRFAAVDPVWKAYREANPATPKALAIAATRFGYLLLLEDHTVRYVGENVEGTFGNGSTSEKGGREVANPGISKVIAIAKGEYFCMALKDNGKISVWGSNEEGQLGVGRAFSELTRTPIVIESLANVTAIAAGGVKRGSGANNGDVAIALMPDKTVRTWGSNFSYGDAASKNPIPWGTLGDYTSETRASPVEPAIGEVEAVFANPTRIMVLKPGTPPTPSLRVTLVGKAVKVDWIPVAGTPGTQPVWRAPEGWKVNLIGPSGFNSPALPANTTSWTSAALPAGTVQVRVIETFITENAVLEGGPTYTAVAGILTLKWAAMVKVEPGQLAEVLREGEKQWRRYPELPGSATSLTAPVPPAKAGIVSEVFSARVKGTWPGAYQTRTLEVQIP